MKVSKEQIANMSLTKKIAIPVVALAIASGAYAANYLSSPIAIKGVHVVSSITPDTQTDTTTTPTATPTTVQPTTVTPTQQTQTQTTTPTTTTPTPPQPEYGEDPNNPGVYIVFDHTAVMNAAGIPADQQAAADTLISHLMLNWRYKYASGQEADLCYVMPEIRMDKFGSDYKDNPITQLKYCNYYAQTRFGGWNQALGVYNQNPTFGIFD